MNKEKQEVEIRPEEKDLSEIIMVLKENIKQGIHMLNPDACFTKGQMRYMIEILEKECKNG